MQEWLVANRDALIAIGALFNSIGAVAAVVIFVLALVQYWRSEKWRKTEFSAQLYKDFSNNGACRYAMWMLDACTLDIDSDRVARRNVSLSASSRSASMCVVADGNARSGSFRTGMRRAASVFVQFVVSVIRRLARNPGDTRN